MANLSKRVLRKVKNREIIDLLNTGVSYIANEYRFQTTGKSDLRRLNKNHPEIAEAIVFSLNDSVDPNDRKKISKIETIRSELDSSKKEVQLRYDVENRTDLEVQIRENIEGQTTLSDTSKSHPLFCRLLYNLARKTGSRSGLELGTSVGIAASYQALGLQHNEGRLITIEGSEEIHDIARENFEIIGVNNIEPINGIFQEVLNDLLENNMVDFVYIDGNHTEDATIEYFDMIYPHVEEGGIVIFDDIYWSEGMERAWKKIRSDDRVSVSIDTGCHGICILHGNSNEQYIIPINQKTIIN